MWAIFALSIINDKIKYSASRTNKGAFRDDKQQNNGKFEIMIKMDNKIFAGLKVCFKINLIIYPVPINYCDYQLHYTQSIRGS